MRLNTMDSVAGITALEALRAHGTVTEAAAVLGRSPSALSAQIKRMAAALGRPLTTPTGRRVALTPHAHRLIDEGLPLLSSLGELFAAGHLDAELTGTVRVAAFSTALRAGVLDATAQLRRDHPRLTVTLLEADPEQAVQAVHHGVADLAVIHNWKGQHRPLPGTETARLIGVDLADVLGGASLGERTWTTTELAEHDWISTGPGTICHSWLTTMFSELGMAPKIICHAADFALHLEFVAAGLGLALVPRLGRPALADHVRTVPLVEPTPRRQVSIAVRTAQRDDPTLSAVRDQLAGFVGRSLLPPSASAE